MDSSTNWTAGHTQYGKYAENRTQMLLVSPADICLLDLVVSSQADSRSQIYKDQVGRCEFK